MRSILFIGLLFAATTTYAQPKTDALRKDENPDGRHIITFTPFCGIVAYGEFNPGAGFDYEYIISKAHGIGVHIPLMLGYAGPEQSGFGNGDYRHTSFYAAPGIRFHTGNSGSDVDFITGPSVLIGNLHFKPVEDYYNPTTRTPYNYNMLGLMADNTLNFYHRHFVFGIDVRVGTLMELQKDTRFFIHFGLHFGGKF